MIGLIKHSAFVMKGMVLSMLRFADILISLVYPRRCPFCGAALSHNKHTCESCENSLPHVTGETCLKCARGSEFCRCKERQFAFKSCIAPFYYDGVVKQAVKRFKFKGQQGAATVFAAYTAETLNRVYAGKSFDFVTSVPLTFSEFKSRGYNQSALFGRALAKELSLPYRETLKKPHDIKPQRTCSASQRWDNVSGAFSSKCDLSGKVVLLADDIITTGATLNECAKMLLAVGAHEVCCAVFACVESRR